MDESERHFKLNPITKAGFISRVFFWWMNPFFKLGYKRNLEPSDMYNVAPQDASHVLCARLEIEWNKELAKRTETYEPSLVKALFYTFGKRYAALGSISFFEEGTKVAQPLLLGGLIRYFTIESDMTQTEAYLYAVGVSLCSIVLAILHHPYFFNVQRIGMQMRIACCSIMYKKSLKISNKALSQTTVGQIVNLMSNDVNRFDIAVTFLHFLWIGPLMAIAVLAILWHELGPASLAGFLILILLIPVQAWIGKKFAHLRLQMAKRTDTRVRIMNEIISGMRVIKLYCWEKPFADLVKNIRRLELQKTFKVVRLRGITYAVFFSAGKLAVTSMLTTYALLGGHIHTHQAFMTLLLVTSTGLVLFLFVPFAIQSLAEMSVISVRVKP